MSVMILNAADAAKFDRADGATELYASDGRLIGYFSPAKPKTIRLEPPISDEELRRRESEPGRPLADILRDLEKQG